MHDLFVLLFLLVNEKASKQPTEQQGYQRLQQRTFWESAVVGRRSVLPAVRPVEHRRVVTRGSAQDLDTSIAVFLLSCISEWRFGAVRCFFFSPRISFSFPHSALLPGVCACSPRRTRHLQDVTRHSKTDCLGSPIASRAGQSCEGESTCSSISHTEEGEELHFSHGPDVR